MQEEVLGGGHPDVATTLVVFARTRRGLGAFAEAETLLRQALHVTIEAYGEEHTEVATRLNSLAVQVLRRGAFEEASRLFRRVLELDEKILGRDHAWVAFSLDNLALTLVETGGFAEADGLLDRAHDLLVASRGSGSPALSINLRTRAKLLEFQGRSREALPLLERAVDIFGDGASGDTRRIAALAELAHLESELGLPGAEDRYRGAWELLAASPSGRVQERVEVLQGLGGLLVRSGRSDEGRVLVERAVELAAQLPDGHYDRDAAAFELASSRVADGRADEASGLLEELAAALESREGLRARRLESRVEELRMEIARSAA